MRRKRSAVARPTSPRRTSGFAAAVSLFTSVAVLVSGCRTPLYVCNHGRPTPPPIVQVRFDDQRPKWERKYYLGGALNDVTFIPAERICPQPWEQFRERLEVHFGRHGVQPTDVAFTVRACRVVVNNKCGSGHCTNLHDVRPQSDQKTQVHWVGYEPTFGSQDHDDDDDDLGSELMGLAVLASLYATGVAAYEVTRHAAHWLHLRPGHAGPPMKLDTDGYAPGTTFEMSGELSLKLPNGEAKTVTVYETKIILSPHGPATETVKTAVQLGADEAADRAVREVLGLSPVDAAAGPLVMGTNTAGPDEVTPIAAEASTAGATPAVAPYPAPPIAQSFSTTPSKSDQMEAEMQRLRQLDIERNQALLNQKWKLPK